MDDLFSRVNELLWFNDKEYDNLNLQEESIRTLYRCLIASFVTNKNNCINKKRL